ncbi:MAG: hypothetical protein JWL90_4721 [Chthoniobacteraceae bacterium]|nr:hypothetical protein [Chthoniobacteraceae bacterium]
MSASFLTARAQRIPRRLCSGLTAVAVAGSLIYGAWMLALNGSGALFFTFLLRFLHSL